MQGFCSLLNQTVALLRTRQAYKFFMKDWTALSDLQACADVLSTMRFTRTLSPVVMQHPDAKRILVLAPHPDDEMIGAGGTLIRAVEAGTRVRVLYLTSGGTTPEACRQRESEALAVAAKVGFEAELMRQPAFGVSTAPAVVEELCERIGAFGPDALLVTFLLDDHDDHRRASELLMRAAQSGRLPDELPLWAYQVYTAVIPNVLVDITGVHEAKADAIRLFTSQMKSRDWSHFALGLNAYNSRFLRGNPAPRYAEAFFVVPLNEYAELCRTYFAEPSRAYYSEHYTSGT